ncbi:hypothetical protein MD484_g8485, partial [Candolleomyces efflorescens]
MSMKLESHQRRAAQTNAVCVAEYAWANTLESGKSPCLVASELLAPCNGGNWIVPAFTDPAQVYANPNSTTATPCSWYVNWIMLSQNCVLNINSSWAVYNLLSACSDCQGSRQAVRMWLDYKANCPGDYLGNTTYYFTEFLPVDATIPFWAATDPTKWTNNQFNIVQAKAIAEERHADISRTSSRRSTPPVGAIVGGVIGGLALILAGIGIAYYLLQRHKKKIELAHPETTNTRPNAANPSSSNTSRTRPGLEMVSSTGYAALTSDSGCGGTSPSPIIRAHSFSLVRPNSIRTTYSTPTSPLSPVDQDGINYNPPAYDFSGDVKDRNMTESGFPRDEKERTGDPN